MLVAEARYVDVQGQVTVGSERIRKKWQNAASAFDYKPQGEIVAQTTPDQALGIVWATLETTGATAEPTPSTGKKKKKSEPTLTPSTAPLRAVAVFERRDGTWKLAYFAEAYLPK